MCEVERLELALKGKPEPVPAYRPDRRARRSRIPSEADTPMLGRDAEVQRAPGGVREHRGRGNSAAGDGDRRGRCRQEPPDRGLRHGGRRRGRGAPRPLPGRTATASPSGRSSRSCADAAGILEDDSADEARERIARCCRPDDPDREAVVDRVVVGHRPVDPRLPGHGDLLGRPPVPGERWRRAGPSCVVVDDIHAAEATFLDLLDAPHRVTHAAPAARARARAPVARSREARRAGGRRRAAIGSSCDPSAPRRVESIIDELLGHASLSPRDRGSGW